MNNPTTPTETRDANNAKLLPYGISDFEDLRSQNRYYADKTRYIPLLERAGDFLFLIRPRRFGKSVFLSMVRCYYDIAAQGKFDELFDGLWIQSNPTPLKCAYQIMYFDFSQANVGRGGLEENFHDYCSDKLISFAIRYEQYYAEDFLAEVKRRAPDSGMQLRYICDRAKERGNRLYLIIDEYDNFTNDVLNEQGEAVYHALTHATGFYREVFKIYKANFQKILFMGISPVTLDDLSSGFNIATNISIDPRFNMALGFSETEVREMIAYYKSTGLISADTEDMIEDMKPWYNNYCFARASLATDPKMFNTDMVTYYIKHYIDFGCAPENMLDTNTRTDYKKLRRLVQLDGMTEKERGMIRRIAAEGQIRANINTSFPAERIFDRENFISLLYYYGMLTMTGTDMDSLILSIPNNNVRVQYYEYLLNEYRPSAGIDTLDLSAAFRAMAAAGDYKTVLTMIAEGYKNVSSNRNAMQGERNFQGFLMAFLSLSKLYLTAPEIEMSHGYCDIFLMPDKARYPEVKHSYIIELKYLAADASEQEAQKQWEDGVSQARRYAADRKVELMTRETQLHLVVLQMRVCELARVEEVPPLPAALRRWDIPFRSGGAPPSERKT